MLLRIGYFVRRAFTTVLLPNHKRWAGVPHRAGRWEQLRYGGARRAGGACKAAGKELANLRADVSLSSLLLMVFHPA